MLKHIIITRFGISDQFSYPVQEFMLKNDTLKNGTSRIGLYGSAPPGLRLLGKTADHDQNVLLCDDFCAGILFIQEK